MKIKEFPGPQFTCDICGKFVNAVIDAPTNRLLIARGPWAFMCKDCTDFAIPNWRTSQLTIMKVRTMADQF